MSPVPAAAAAAAGRLLLLLGTVGMAASMGAAASLGAVASAWTVPARAETPAEPVDAAVLRHGAEVYTRCLACHAIEANRTGPRHCGLFGRKAGTAAGFDGYSPALRASGVVWNEQTLDRFLADPPGTVPGTYMTYAGVNASADRRALIAWLAQATRPGRDCHPVD